MSKDEMHKILTGHLDKFRTWNYSQLAERVGQDRKAHDWLEHIEGTAPEMALSIKWNFKHCGMINPEARSLSLPTFLRIRNGRF